MKRKLVITLCAAAAAICTAVGLAACGGGNAAEDRPVWGEEYTLSAAYEQARQLGYTGSLEDFIAAVSGKDGTGILSAEVTADGELIITLTAETQLNAGKVSGEDGKDGEQGLPGPAGTDGTGIKEVYISDGRLYVVLTDGSAPVDCGEIVPAGSCSHEYGEWTTVLDAGCDSSGYNTRTCGKCGDEEHRFIMPAGHAMPSGADLAADSEIHAYFCTDCGDYVSERHEIVEGGCTKCGFGLYYSLNEDGSSWSVTGARDLLSGDVIIPATYKGLPVTGIAARAFENENSLRNADILGENLETVGDGAFKSCINLKSVRIPASVTEIGTAAATETTGAFEDCAALEKVTFEENAVLNIIGNRTFADCASLKEITIPSSVTAMGYASTDYAGEIGVFTACTALEKIAFENGSRLESLGNSAFERTPALKSIELPEGVKTLGTFAFLASGLESISVPASVETIVRNTFGSLPELVSVTFEAGSRLKNIPSDAFNDCPLLKSVTFEEGSCLETVRAQAFGYCPQLEEVTGIPESAQVDPDAFYNCPLVRRNGANE